MPVEEFPIFEPGVEWKPIPRDKLDIELGTSDVEWEPSDKGWVIDPLAYYIPFSTGERNWGIKLIVKKMLEDWRNLNTWTLKSGIYFPWSLYVSVITLHELGHHIVEECLIRSHESYLNFRADPLNRRLEEGLCEYTAFALLGKEKTELSLKLFVDPLLFLRPRPDDIGAITYGTIATHLERCYDWELLWTTRGKEECLLSLTFLVDNLFGKALLDRNVRLAELAYARPMKYWLSILYYWWNRSGQQNPYRPKIDPRIWAIVGPRYVKLLIRHLKLREPSLIPLPNYFAILRPSLGGIYLHDVLSVEEKKKIEQYVAPEKFFSVTYISNNLKQVFESILDILERSDGKIIELSAPTGGGKTHTLLAVYHAFRNPEALRLADPRNVANELANRIKKFKEKYGEVEAIIIDGEFESLAPSLTKPLDAGTCKIYTIWGFMAYQLGKYELMRGNDQPPFPVPSVDELKKLFQDRPVIILIDNFAKYLLRLINESFLDKFITFIKRLSISISGKRACILVAMLEEDQPVHEPIVWRTIEFVPPLHPTRSTS